MFASSKLVSSKATKKTNVSVAVVPGKQFNLLYNSLDDICNFVSDSTSDPLEIIIYLPDQQTPIHILEGTNKEKSTQLRNKLHELTS